ncbi:MAG: hypothetical protein HYU46_09550 [Deltaproteobacteria bacterium]|nr:hypothetical protein [Deltaproteobacteria bacterium]
MTTSGGVVGWGESFGTARPMVVAAFDNWIRRLAVGQSASDEELVPRIERMLLSLSRSGPLAHALAGLDIALWDIRGKLAGVPVSTLLGGAKRTHVESYASLLQYYGNPEHLKRNTARALERGYRQIKLHERTPEAVAAARRWRRTSRSGSRSRYILLRTSKHSQSCARPPAYPWGSARTQPAYVISAEWSPSAGLITFSPASSNWASPPRQK